MDQTQPFTLLLPILLIALGAAVAALGGLPRLNQRLAIDRVSWLLALFPLGAFVLILLRVPALANGDKFSWQIDWLPSLGLSFGLYLDGLSALFGLIVTLIGVIVVIYGGQYFKGDQSAWRFQTYQLMFMASMLGLVMASDVISLFIFWEGTSIISFLLVAYKTKDEAARQGAFRALFITGGGGIALLAGLLFVSYVAGDTTFATILKSGDALRASPLYPVMLGLVAFGAFTKSAQFPAHIWLPGAMSAPTPASAYLHSATMVKAGIFLMARMNPALGFTETWFWLLTMTGMVTMLAGAYLGLKQNDLKALLAYSTISQLGVLMMLIGQDIAEAFKALVIGVLAHALYKSALFLVAGIVDHETGTRDIRRLGGLRKEMPFTFVIAFVAALSMAGLPPLFGFLAKETLLAAAVHPTLPPLVAAILPWTSVLAGALMLAQAGVLVYETFMGKPKDPSVHGHEAPRAMWLMPAIPTALSLIIALLPRIEGWENFLGAAAGAAYGDKVKVSLALWHGVNLPLVLSMVAISLGTLIFLLRKPIRARMSALLPSLSFNAVYFGTLRGINGLARLSTLLQAGRLRYYLAMMIAAAVALVVIFSGRSLSIDLSAMQPLTAGGFGATEILRLFALLVINGAALVTVLLHRDFGAVLALSAAGLGMALMFVLEPAPDVAMVQIVVDILSTVILLLALTRLPRSQRAAAQQLGERELRGRPGALIRDLLVAGSAGLLVMLLTFNAMTSRPRDSIITPYFEANSKTAAGATDIVGAIVVDFRQLDTVIEITVFSVAGLGAYMLLRMAAFKFSEPHTPATRHPITSHPTYGIGGKVTSSFVRVPAFVTLPLAIILGATHMIYGHQQVGDGFTAGVIIALAVALWYVVFGYEETRRRLPWLRGMRLIAAGILLVFIAGTASYWLEGYYFAHVNFGKLLNLPLPKGFDFSSAFLFELSICLAVLGSASLILSTLGHPGQQPVEIGE